MAQICCSCKHWSLIKKDTHFCSKCARPLDAEDYRELVALEDAAAQELHGVRQTIQRLKWIPGIATIIILVRSDFNNNPYPVCLLLAGVMAGIMAITWHQARTEKRWVTKYKRLWSMPSTFRPSIRKS